MIVNNNYMFHSVTFINRTLTVIIEHELWYSDCGCKREVDQ